MSTSRHMVGLNDLEVTKDPLLGGGTINQLDESSCTVPLNNLF